MVNCFQTLLSVPTRAVQHGWLRWASAALHLSHYLIPEEAMNARAATATAAAAEEMPGVGLQPGRAVQVDICVCKHGITRALPWVSDSMPVY